MKKILFIAMFFVGEAFAVNKIEMLIIPSQDKSTLDSKNTTSPKLGRQKLTSVTLTDGTFALNSKLLTDCNDPKSTWFHYKDFLNGLQKRLVDIDSEVIMPKDVVEDVPSP